jgi:NADH:ubiquinone oxidoreductase subunit 5 (subunit L)/multisubunit Na+/H+ antiporter MnhA subunit
MNAWLSLLVALPLIGFLLSLVIPGKKENWISGITLGTLGLQLNLGLVLLGAWLFNGHRGVNFTTLELYNSREYVFEMIYYLDFTAFVFWLVGAILSFMVVVYSRYYLHREEGYKRFFNTVLFFYLGYTITIFAGNLETLFLGWEILGISSFLLIAFYRNRYLPVKNAVKIFSIYRIGDVGILLAMWASHHLWHESITFQKLLNYELVHEHISNHSWVGIFIALMILLAASAKSAQLPFSSWLPRAMEGPTPSSAIFYGSLAVHMGVFLMLRTYPFWEHQIIPRVMTGFMGVTTALVATGIARVQSSVKAQIAYASIAQIGLIFVEMALGLRYLALFHFVGNAFLRTYQLLVSPSVVSYLIREQFYEFNPGNLSIESKYPLRLRYTFYVLCLKEFNLDFILYRYLWMPIKWAGKQLDFITINNVFYLFVPIFVAGWGIWLYEPHMPSIVRAYMPFLCALAGLILVLKAFSERTHIRISWVMIVLNHCWIALAISLNEHFDMGHVLLYLSGVLVAGAFGFFLLMWLKQQKENVDLDRFHGHVIEYPKVAFLFLLACLGITGFPITATFIGEDLIFSHIHTNQWVLASLVSLSFIIDGLAAIRIYARVFLGPPVTSAEGHAFRSA